MLNIIVCENERAEREYLAALIKKWAGLRNAAIRFSAYESAESFLFAYEEDKAADILLLDIQIHYAEVENMYNQMRGWRHDYRNHIQAMKGHANSGDLAAISRYLDELDTDLKKVDTIIKTGNKMADAILDSKISLARSKNITVIADQYRRGAENIAA
jgi:DNA-binding LytR/AlgR family response regulator